MSQQLSTSRSWRLAGVVPMVALLVSCGIEVDREPEQISPSVQAVPPPAVAPPDGGVDPPPLNVLPEGGPPLPTTQRPQLQLTAWAESMSDELNIPRVALQAYGYAATAVEQSHPGCGLGWSTLAGIGAIESSHGRYGGARLDETGRPSTPIIGLPLDGSHGVKRIDDTDGGRLDGDPVYDRAIGPLQFIPTTWERWAVDADGDGIADPHDIDDAALAAAEYLCTVGGDMQDPDRFWAALLDYNESHDYGQDVLDHADHYGKTSRSLFATD